MTDRDLPGVVIMNRTQVLLIFAVMTSLFFLPAAVHGADPPFKRQEDIIYGRKFGMALTMDVFTP